MQSAVRGPVNIRCPQRVSVAELAHTVAAGASKEIRIKYVDVPWESARATSITPGSSLLAGALAFFSGKESNVPILGLKRAFNL